MPPPVSFKLPLQSSEPVPGTPSQPQPQSYADDASEELQTAIWEAFGDYDTFKANFTAAAAGVFGSGWAWLVVNDSGKLAVVTTPNQVRLGSCMCRL